MIEAGVSSILNFAPTIVSVPTDVSLRKVDLAVELQILSFYQQRKAGAEAGAGANSGRVTAAGAVPPLG
jgi:redox-sensing transcriptional repressor